MTKFSFPYNYKLIILNCFLIIYLSVFVRNITDIYYVILLLLISSSLFIYFIESRLFDFTENVAFLYIIFISYQVIIALISFYQMSRFEYGLDTLLIGSLRLFLAPLMVIILYSLVWNSKLVKYILGFYAIFIFIASLTIIAQHFLGQFEFLSPPYGAPRHGLYGYASITGNVTSYAPSAAVASMIIFLSDSRKYFFKAIIISSILAASILTMGKSGLMNTTIILLLFLYLGYYSKNYYTLFYILLIGIIGIYFSNTLYFAIISLFVNTTGIEILGFKLSEAIEFQNFIPRITDRLFGKFITFEEFGFLESFFGLGIKAGGGVFGIANTATSHNTYIDMFRIGGFTYILIFVILIIMVQFKLRVNFKNHNDNISYCLFWANNLLFLNMLLMNGAIYHPVISFILWISILYVINYKKMNQ